MMNLQEELNNYRIKYGEYVLERIYARKSERQNYLKKIKEDVLYLAARCRGWEDKDTQMMFKNKFKIEPLFEASDLALVWKGAKLVGTAGCVDDWYIDDNKILHLCALGLLPEAQNKGFMKGLMAVMLDMVLRDQGDEAIIKKKRGYISAITQSPFLLSYLSKLFDVWPLPNKKVPEDVLNVAEAVVNKYDPEVYFEKEELILRNECDFFYKSIPYSRDKKINAYCDAKLNYCRGDVFVIIGKINYLKTRLYVSSLKSKYPELFQLNQVAG